MDKSYLLVTGIFRSGTTWLARALNANRYISFESDPVAPIFNSFRYDLAKKRKKNKRIKRFSPLGDYFGDSSEFIKDILESNFEIPVDKKNLDIVFRKIKKKNLPFENGFWTETFNGFKNCKNYKQSILSVLNHIKNISKKKSKVIGFKEVWINEMAGAFLNTFKKSKVILIVRDPRAILASRNAMIKKYPTVFIGRQWRKSVLIANYLKNKYQKRILILKYEDATLNKYLTLKKICKFLNVRFDNKMIDENNYKDGLGNPWKQNSSFTLEGKKYLLNAKETKKISIKFKKNYLKKNTKTNNEKWKTELDKKDILTIEFLCHEEMKKFGYKLKNSLKKLNKFNIKDYKKIKVNQLADWIRPYSEDRNNVQIKKIIKQEKNRKKLLKKKLLSFSNHIF